MRRTIRSLVLALVASPTSVSSMGSTADAGPVVDLASGVVELPILDVGSMVTGSADGVMNSVAPLIGSIDAPGHRTRISGRALACRASVRRPRSRRLA